MLGRLPRLPRLPARFAATLLALCMLSPSAAQAGQAGQVGPVEDYASYQPQVWCAKAAKPGTVVLGRWLVRTYGGGFGPIWRRCAGKATSEHKEGRAFDWTLDATRKADRNRARAFLDRVFATDAAGNEHALARRMGIMYVIWNDRMFAAYDQFVPRPYLSSSCRTRARCSRTLRHRDHLHVSLSRRGGAGTTSWYAGRLPPT